MKQQLKSKKDKDSQLKKAILSSEITFAMEAHDAISALISQRAGFEILWASGLTISTSLGYRDANEATWLHTAEVVERMADAVSTPILVDVDSGYGNFNNARISVKKIFERGASGVCIEDKEFPKMNSFVGNKHPLAEINEFCGRIKAIKDHVPNSDFVLVARIEALIAGHSESEALDRAHAYIEAGADSILIHSRKSNADEILSFSEKWDNKAPLVIVPTKYYNTPIEKYRDAKISTVIWANHNLRASISAMTELCNRIYRDENIISSEDKIATLNEVFELLNYKELELSESSFLDKNKE
ncbi:phosphoenolpyruvate mutase [Hafnia psychrotolerans]|uniref:phosphoenolpyruvate mutase n=1 Tax=Hafnia psychrotolerans TaxID=1477018 RepID=A0ABQ1GIY2_9GAMM|nr:phosphoenolpyruvate mutase [Hafnia psychrotolerans]GGA44528.1 hypothetical protein GCM10011328_19520 [Hafnia psychrotolerans]